MIPVMDWLERTFAHGTDPRLLPPAIERLRGSPARLAECVAAWPPGRLTERPGEDWSGQEHVGHLLELEALVLARLDDFDAGREVLTAADLSNRATWEGHYNERRIDEVLAAFRARRAESVARLEALDLAGAARVALHPRLQVPMNVVDCVMFFAEHDDHHLAQMRALMSQYGA